MAVLDDILQANAAAGDPAPAASGDFKAAKGLCVVTCTDPRLDGLLGPALGLRRGDAAVVRLPGPALGGGQDLLRAVATAVFVNACREVLVLVPLDGALLQADAGSISSSVSSSGVSRAALGDVRTFFALGASARQMGIETAAAIRAAPFLPRDLLVHTALIEPGTGSLELVERGENVVRPTASPGVAEAPLPTLDGPSLLGSSSFGGPSALSGPSAFGGSGGSSSFSGTSAFGGPVSSFGTMPTGLGMPSSDFSSTGSSQATGPSQLGGPAPIMLDAIRGMEGSNIDLQPSVVLNTPTRLEAAQMPEMSPQATPAPARPVPPRPPPRKQQAKPQQARPQGQSQAPARVNLSAPLRNNVMKISAFYRAEIPQGTRQEAAAALDAAFQDGSANAEMIRVVFKPILESGPKRYKVIDELLAVKEATSSMQRTECHAALRLLVG